MAVEEAAVLPRPDRRRRIWVRLGIVATSLVLTLVFLEGALRFVLFSDFAREHGIGWRLRNAALYAPLESGRENWKLRVPLGMDPSRRHPHFDARLGWHSGLFDPVSFEHVDEASLGARRPLLLFGDSYAQCVPEAGNCWQDLLEESVLAERYRLLNYGVGGYGLDQIWLLMQPVLERFRARDPLVVVGVLVDDDLDRTYLALRAFPKPYFVLEGNELVLHPVEHQDPDAYLRDDPPAIRSYLWRWFLFGSDLVPRHVALGWTDEADHVEVKRALDRRLLEEIQVSLQGLESFFVLFHARRALVAPGPYSWQEPFIYEAFADLDIPFVSSKRTLRAHLARTGLAAEELYLRSGPGVNHYTGATNEVVFETLRAGIESRFEPYEYLPADRSGLQR